MIKEFEVNINKRRFKRKPDNIETAGIQGHFQTEIMPFSQLRQCLVTGCTVKPAILKADGYFKSQQVFFVDVDSGATVTENLDKSKKRGIVPNLIYKTFSGNVKNQKHRLVFVMPEPITDIRERDEIQTKLVALFRGDSLCTNLNRIFYGGNCQYFYNPYFYTDVEKVRRIRNRIRNPS